MPFSMAFIFAPRESVCVTCARFLRGLIVVTRWSAAWTLCSTVSLIPSKLPSHSSSSLRVP